MLSIIKPQVEKALTPVANIFRHVSPNVITLFGLLFPILFFACIVNGYYLLGLVVFVFNAVDLLDGIVARTQNKVTAFGGFLDSTVDRFADFVVLVAFGFADIVAWEVVLTLVLLTYLISYIRSRTELAAKGTLVADVGIVERPERLVTLFVGLALYALFTDTLIAGYNYMVITFGILIVFSFITVAQRIHFAYKHL